MSKSSKITQSWTIIGSLISLVLAAAFVLYAHTHSWVPKEWADLAVGLGTGNIFAIILRLRTLNIYRKESK